MQEDEDLARTSNCSPDKNLRGSLLQNVFANCVTGLCGTWLEPCVEDCFQILKKKATYL